MNKIKKNIPKEIAKSLLDIKAITLRPQKPFKYTSGLLGPVYTDNRIIISYPKVRSQIIDAYIEVIKKEIGLKNVDLLSGTATAAIPHAAFISQKMNLPMVYVRGSKKGHGKENQIEGVVEDGQKTVVIEDHISTSGSLVGNVRAIRRAKGTVNYAIATTTYQFPIADKSFKEVDIKVLTLTTFPIILDVALGMKYINAKDKHLVEDWLDDPKGWAKRHGFE
jgi:orotate phosphoribosyltransferase